MRDGPDPLEYGVWWHETLEFMPWDGDAAAIGCPRKATSPLRAASGKGFQERAAQEWGRLLASEPWRLMRDPRWRALAEVGIFAPFRADGWIDGVMDLVLHDPGAAEVWIVDWKTNRRQAREDDAALLARLSSEYAGQLSAYGECAAGFFPGCAVRKWVYSSVAGLWSAIESPIPRAFNPLRCTGPRLHSTLLCVNRTVGSLTHMGNLKKKRRLKMNKHKRRKRLKSNRHKKRTWQK